MGREIPVQVIPNLSRFPAGKDLIGKTDKLPVPGHAQHAPDMGDSRGTHGQLIKTKTK
jgi:hypothetical protein